MLARLPRPAQSRLIDSMNGIEALLGAKPEPDIAAAPAYILRAPRPGDFGWIVARHAELYAEEYNWREPFEGLCAQIVADFVNNFDPKMERCWIAERNGENVGTVMLVKDKPGVARLRLLLVEPRARGLGIGARLTGECIRFARQGRLSLDHAVDPQRADRRPPYLRAGRLHAHLERAAPLLGPGCRRRILGFEALEAP